MFKLLLSINQDWWVVANGCLEITAFYHAHKYRSINKTKNEKVLSLTGIFCNYVHMQDHEPDHTLEASCTKNRLRKRCPSVCQHLFVMIFLRQLQFFFCIQAQRELKYYTHFKQGSVQATWSCSTQVGGFSLSPNVKWYCLPGCNQSNLQSRTNYLSDLFGLPCTTESSCGLIPALRL